MVEVTKLGVAGALVAVMEEMISLEDQRSYDEMLRNLLSKILPMTMDLAPKTNYDGWKCHDCSKIDGGYMLKDEVWERATGGDGTIRRLCLSCASKRLGIRPQPGDFSDAPINQPILWALDCDGESW